MTESVRTKISNALLARLDLVTELKYKAFDSVKLMATDFQEWEIPAVQAIDLAEIITHEMRRAKKSWNLVLEVIVGPTSSDTPDQRDLWDLMETIERQLWAVPNLGLSEVIHMQLLSTSTDLHLLKPFYLGRIELAVLYYQPLVGDC